ncbi:hypothetical protein [Kitasatospora phosalacinea]|uniref:hypothetical protein n=1 Tax=Kitasatospora phosalacinea TaxID=2065 RepID=UPI001428A1AA|nr:hypothetical protein [Kitasatospora phosalacinea]
MHNALPLWTRNDHGRDPGSFKSGFTYAHQLFSRMEVAAPVVDSCHPEQVVHIPRSSGEDLSATAGQNSMRQFSPRPFTAASASVGRHHSQLMAAQCTPDNGPLEVRFTSKRGTETIVARPFTQDRRLYTSALSSLDLPGLLRV